MAETNQMPRDQRDSPVPVLPVVRCRSLAATTTSGAVATPALRWKTATIWATAACWICIDEDPLAVTTNATTGSVNIEWTTSEAGDIFQITLTSSAGAAEVFTLTTVAEANADAVATALAALVDASGNYAAVSSTSAVIITSASGDTFTIATAVTNVAEGTDDAVMTVTTTPKLCFPLIANTIRSFAITQGQKVAAITTAGTATVYIEENGN